MGEESEGGGDWTNGCSFKPRTSSTVYISQGDLVDCTSHLQKWCGLDGEFLDKHPQQLCFVADLLVSLDVLAVSAQMVTPPEAL